MPAQFSMLFIFLFSAFLCAGDGAFLREDLPPSIEADRSVLMVDRQALGDDSHMRTISITQAAHPNTPYRISLRGFVLDNDNKLQTLPAAAAVKPESVDQGGIWTDESSNQRSDANILGTSDSFLIDSHEIRIPVARTTPGTLAYYGAHLMKIGDTIMFNSDAPLPVTIMNIGKNYAQDYLMNSEYGGGFYLEVHDRPHFHMPLNENAKGYLVLGKMISEDLYELSAFRIPFGYAIYTPGGIIHDDGFLVGDYMVIFSVTKEYKTAIVKGPDMEPALVTVVPSPDQSQIN